jgi:DNA replication and repair protein RecF
MALSHTVSSAPSLSGGIDRLGLQSFRNYSLLSLETHASQILLTGANGIGKTNILEAISLFAPGRGLRGATSAEWRRLNDATSWRLTVQLEGGERLTTGAPLDKPDAARRQILHENVGLSSQAELAEYLAIVWLTPQMDGLFLSDAAARRKFVDRLVYAVHPEHAVHLARYEHALRQRNKLLKDKASAELIRAFHPILATEGVVIAASRLECTERLNRALDTMQTQFPLPELQWQGDIEALLQDKAAVAVEQIYHERLDHNIDHDRLIGQTRLGVHRSDVAVINRQKNIAAAQCSTGEQKALLLSLVLAHAQWLKTIEPQRPLILLLDEVTAHFDETRRRDMFDWVTSIPAQAWFTGTDAEMFAPIADRTLHYTLPFNERAE